MPSPFLRGKGDRLRWMRVDLTLLLSLTIKRTVSPHQALRARSLRGKPCIVDPCSEQLTVLYKIPRLTLGMTRMIFIFRDPSARLLQGSQKVSKNFLGRGAAGAAGKAASIARRLPWRLASDELRMTEEQKRPLTGGASTSKTPPLTGGAFFTFFGKRKVFRSGDFLIILQKKKVFLHRKG